MVNTFLQEQSKFWFKIKLSLLLIATWWFVAFFNLYLDISLKDFSLQPYNFEHWYSIFTYPFIHGDIEHLINNSLSGFIIFSALFLVYEKNSLLVLGIIYLISGILLWFLGQKGSMHIGASSVIYGVAFFLFFSGAFSTHSAKRAIAFLMVAWYGGMVWGITPFTVENGISWEGHLSGAMVGFILAILYFEKEDKLFSDEEIEDDTPFFVKYPIEFEKENNTFVE